MEPKNRLKLREEGEEDWSPGYFNNKILNYRKELHDPEFIQIIKVNPEIYSSLIDQMKTVIKEYKIAFAPESRKSE